MTNDSVPGALDEYIAKYQGDPDYVAEGMALEVAEQVVLLLEQKGMTRTALASAMGVSQAFVSRVLNAPPNLTLRSIAKLSIALGVRPVFQLVPGAAPGQIEPGPRFPLSATQADGVQEGKQPAAAVRP